MEFQELIEARYSCRAFSDQPVEQEKLDAVLQAGSVAPTGKNMQPQRIVVVRSDEGRATMKECTPCSFDAPVILVVCYDSEHTAHNDFGDGRTCGHEDASIVMTHMMLACYDQGLGCTWVGYLANDKLREAFVIPDTYEIIGLLPLGYPAEDAKPSVRHADRKPIEETVFYESF